MSYNESLIYFGLSDLYTERELKNKYYSLAKKNHPDQNENTEEEMKKINSMYDILSNELKKRVLREFKDNFFLNISKLKDKYKDTKIYSLCILYENKLKDIKNINDAKKLKEEFNLEIDKLKSEIVLPIERSKVLDVIQSYFKGYSKEIKEIANNYYSLVSEVGSLENLNTLKQKFDSLMKDELLKEKERINRFKSLKDNLKRSSIYNFYQYAKTVNIDEIKLAYKLLMTILDLLNITTIDNIDEIARLIEKVDYSDINNEIGKFELYYLEKTSNLKIGKINQEFLKHKKEIKVSRIEDSRELIDLILDKYYLYATNKKNTIDKLIKEEELFPNILDSIKNINEEKKDLALKYVKDTTLKNIKIVLEGIDDFLDPSKLYIERETGEICVIKESNDKVYTIFLNGKVDKGNKLSKDLFQYMSVVSFFLLSKYSNGFEIDEVSRKDTIKLSDYDTNYLYYTDGLLLYLKENEESLEFKFISNIKGYKFELSNNSQITRNDYFDYYKDKDRCLADLLIFIKSKLEDKNNKKIL